MQVKYFKIFYVYSGERTHINFEDINNNKNTHAVLLLSLLYVFPPFIHIVFFAAWYHLVSSVIWDFLSFSLFLFIFSFHAFSHDLHLFTWYLSLDVTIIQTQKWSVFLCLWTQTVDHALIFFSAFLFLLVCFSPLPSHSAPFILVLTIFFLTIPSFPSPFF